MNKNEFNISKTYFNIEQTLECGQVFRYKQIDTKTWEIISKDKKCIIFDKGTTYLFKSKDKEYYKNYFDTKTNYELITKTIKSKLQNLPVDAQQFLNSALDYGKGIHILKQDKFEVLVSFIISANNNITRIKKIIETLCQKFGTKKDNFFSFPTLEQLKKVTLAEFNNIGAGYRGEYLYKTINALNENWAEEIEDLPTYKLRNYLISLSGIGPKVADCILLFGFNRQDVFPVDTWVAKVYYDHFSTKKQNRTQISNFFVELFCNESGYTQQYLFFKKRSLKTKRTLQRYS